MLDDFEACWDVVAPLQTLSLPGIPSAMFADPEDDGDWRPEDDQSFTVEAVEAVEAQDPPTLTFSDELRGEIITQYIGYSEGRRRLAETMTNPLREIMDRRSPARPILPVAAFMFGADLDPQIHIASSSEGLNSTKWPPHIRMGAWVKHTTYGYYAQVVRVVSDDTALLDIWDGHGFSTLPEDILMNPDGYIIVNLNGVATWQAANEPKIPTSTWEHLDEDD